MNRINPASVSTTSPTKMYTCIDVPATPSMDPPSPPAQLPQPSISFIREGKGGGVSADTLVGCAAVQNSDGLSRLLSEPVPRSPSVSSDRAGLNDSEDYPLPVTGDRIVVDPSSVISSHEASFCNSLTLGRLDNPNGLENFMRATGRDLISPTPHGEAEVYERDRTTSLGTHVPEVANALVPHSAEFKGETGAAALSAVTEPAPQRRTSPASVQKRVQSGVAAARPQSLSSNEAFCSNPQPHTPHCCLTPPTGEVKTLQELLDWRAHISTLQPPRSTQQGHTAEDEGIAATRTCRERVLVLTKPTIVAPVPDIQLINLHMNSAASSSHPSTTAVTPVESNATCGDTLSVKYFSHSEHGHPSSGEFEQTELADVHLVAGTPLLVSSHRPPTAMQLNQEHLFHTPPQATLEQDLTLDRSPAIREPRTLGVITTCHHVARGRNTKANEVGQSSSADSPASLSLSPRKQSIGRKEPPPSTNTGRRSPSTHAFFSHEFKHRSRVCGAGQQPRTTTTTATTTPYASPEDLFVGCGSRQTRNTHHVSLSNAVTNHNGIQHQHPRNALLVQAASSKTAPLQHSMTRPPYATTSPRCLQNEDYATHAVLADENTNKAVVAFFSGCFLLICLVVICAM